MKKCLKSLLILVILVGFIGTAVPQSKDDRPLDQTLLAGPTAMSEYWIGVQCGPVPPLLKLHLNLQEKEGVLIENVVPESPAAKAGIEQNDILLNVGGESVSSAAEIIKKVDAGKDKELVVTLIHKGEKKEIKVTPEKRPESAKIPALPPMDGMFRSIQPGVIIEGFDDAQIQELPQDIQKLLEQAHERMKKEQSFFFNEKNRDALKFPAGEVDQIEISIYPKQGDQAGGLTVKKNDQTWDVEKYSDLPKNIQEDVSHLLKPSTNGEELGQWIANQIAEGKQMQLMVTRPKILQKGGGEGASASPSGDQYPSAIRQPKEESTFKLLQEDKDVKPAEQPSQN